MFVFPNDDKDSIQEAENHTNLADFRRGFKMLICGRTGSGKTNVIKWLITQQNPEFDRILICHIDPNTKEYDDVEGELLQSIDELPNPEAVDCRQKILVIIEDMDFESLKKAQKEKLNMYLRYVCSHKGVSLIMACHDPFSVPINYRRKIDVFVLYRFDPQTLSMLAKKCEVTSDDFKYIFSNMINSKHDSICVDLTGSKYLIRFNINTPVITLKD
jgi:hypothetical protein